MVTNMLQFVEHMTGHSAPLISVDASVHVYMRTIMRSGINLVACRNYYATMITDLF